MNQAQFIGVRTTQQPPCGDKHLERLCGLCREQPRLKPLVMEALLHTPLAVLARPAGLLLTGRSRIEVAQARVLDEPEPVPIPLQPIRHLTGGIPEFSAAVFGPGSRHALYLVPEP